jgi:hypothetical protein
MAINLDVVRLGVHRIGALKDAATVMAVVMGGIWTYFLFRWRRLRYPRLNVQHKICHWSASGQVLLHVGVETKSVGEVILKLESILVRVQQLMPLPDSVVDAMTAGEDPVPENHSEVSWQLITERRCDWKKEPREIEPGEIEEHPFDFVIPADVEKIQVYSHIDNARKRRRLLFWKAPKVIGWNTTTVYDLDLSEEQHMSNDKNAMSFRGGQGTEKVAPPTAKASMTPTRQTAERVTVTKQGPPKVAPPPPSGNSRKK